MSGGGSSTVEQGFITHTAHGALSAVEAFADLAHVRGGFELVAVGASSNKKLVSSFHWVAHSCTIARLNESALPPQCSFCPRFSRVARALSHGLPLAANYGR